MTLQDLNNILSKLAQNPGREHVLEFAFAITEWMGLKPNTDKKPQLLTPQTQKLKDYLAPVPQTVQPQLYRLTADGQSMRIRFATLKKLKKDYIGQLVDNDPGLTSYQASSKGIVNIPGRQAYIPSEPYFIHFVTTPAYDRLTLVFNQGDQKRIITFRNRLTHTQYNKIIEQWHGIAAKAKPELADLLWRSLDIKEVNKEFYKEIKERFDALVGIATANKTKATESQVKQFAVKLIGRYIFCWFLKEKGIIPEVLLSRKTILATKDYYKNVLLKLFFETLNTKVQDRIPLQSLSNPNQTNHLNHINHSSDNIPQQSLNDPNQINHTNQIDHSSDKIPYLNGGLFDENEEDKLFKKLEVDEWLAPFVKVLEDYDFTVDESSSNYQHVAVDPEMLGRIFENLLASQNEETEKLANQRKAYGAFYTPREIVDYMVNESLKAYLQTSWEEHIVNEKTKLLNNPEPVADIFGNKKPQQLAIETKKYALKPEEQQKMDKALTALFSAQPNADGLKKEDKNLLLTFLSQIKILDPACGSGAFPMGVLQKLMELHEALGTVKSSYELKKDILSQNIYGVDIMPMAIEIARLRTWLSLVLEEDYKPADAKHNFGVKPLPNLDFKFVCANSLIDLGLDAFIQESKGTLHEGFTQKLVSRLKELEEMRKHYFLPDVEHEQKEEVKKQYLIKRDAVVCGIEAYSDLKLKEIAAKIKDWNPFDDSKNSTFFSPTWMFGIDKGFDVVIGNPPYVYRNSDNKELKKYFTANFKSAEGNFDLYRFFIEKTILILNEHGNSCLIVPNSFLTAKSYYKLRKFILEKSSVLEIFDLGENIFEGVTVENIILRLKNGQNKNPFTKIKIQRNRNNSFDNLDSFYDINLNDVFEKESSFNIYLNSITDLLINKIRINTIELGDIAYCTVGINTGYIKNELTESSKVDETYHKMLSGRDIGINSLSWKNVWIKYDKAFVNSFGDRGRSLPPEYIFTEEKILVQRTRRGLKRKLICYYDTEGYYNLNRLSNIVSKSDVFSLKYIHSLLNSNLMDYYFNILFNEYEVKPVHLAKLPIKIISPIQQQPFITLVEKILFLKKQNQNVSAIEREIDIMVYHLYNLTYEEAKIIDLELSEEEYV